MTVNKQFNDLTAEVLKRHNILKSRLMIIEKSLNNDYLRNDETFNKDRVATKKELTEIQKVLESMKNTSVKSERLYTLLKNQFINRMSNVENMEALHVGSCQYFRLKKQAIKLFAELYKHGELLKYIEKGSNDERKY